MMYIYWIKYGLQAGGIVLAENETEARKKVIDYYKLEMNEEVKNIMYCYHKTIHEFVGIDKACVCKDIIEVYSEMEKETNYD